MIIFDNYDSYEFDEVRRYLLDEFPDENTISDSDVWDEMRRWEEADWEDAERKMTKFFAGRNWIVYGEFGAWDGQKPAGAVFRNFGELSPAWDHCDYVKIWDENGHLYIRASHHDGTNHYEIRRITNAGMRFLAAHEYDAMPLREMHEKVFGSNFYSGLPHYAKWVRENE